MGFHVKVNRYEKDILRYEKYPVETGGVLLYGSSFFDLWGYERAKQQWADATNGVVKVVEHGFGGASVDELLYYYDRMVRPYAPSVAVLRCGVNDIIQGLSAQDAWFLTERLIEWLKADFPEIQIILVNIFDNKALTQERFEKCLVYNRISADYAEQSENVSYLDLNPFFHEHASDCGTQQNFREVFRADGLHLTDDGYAQMAAFLAPKVARLLIRKETSDCRK